MSQRLQLIAVRNPFDRRERETRLLDLDTPRSLLEIIQQQLPAGLPVTVSLNGRTVATAELAITLPMAGDQIVVIPTVHGGDTGKAILRAVLVITVTAIGAMLGQAYLGPMLASSMGAAGGAIVGAGIGAAVGGLLANAVLPPPSISMPKMEGIENSPSYAWNPQTTQAQGLVVPRVYGTFRLYGNIISSHLESDGGKNYLNALVSMGMGPYRQLSDFRINDQPSGNFQGVEIHARLGALDQDPVPNFNDTKTEYPLAVKIVNGAPHTYQTAGTNFDGLEVDITFPSGLWYANDDGGLSPLSVNIQVEVKRQGDVTWTHIAKQVVSVDVPTDTAHWEAGYWLETGWAGDGPSTAEYAWVMIALGNNDPYAHYEGEFYSGGSVFWSWVAGPGYVRADVIEDHVTVTANQTAAIRRTFTTGNLTPGRYDVRVSNLTADRTDTRYGDDLYLTAVREVLYDDFEYPRQVLVGILALATDQLSGSLRFSCLAEAAMVRVYDGAAWTVENSANPAWVMWDLLTQPVLDNSLAVVRYDGMDPSRLDLAKWLEWADYCDTLVPDGAGGQEKRLQFHGGFDSEYTLWDAVMQVGQAGRAVPIWNGVHLTLAIDQPGSPTQLFSVGNVEQDSFEETFLPMADRASEIEVDYINAANDYQRDRLTVIDVDNPNKTNKVTLQLLGCVSASQAWRAAQYRLRSNACLLRVVKWRADVDAIACTVGDVVRLQHDVPQWGEGGRLVAATATTVTLDKTVTLLAGHDYTIMVRRSDDVVVEHVVATGAGTTDTLTLAAPFTVTPAQFDVYAFGESNKVVKTLRLIGIDPDSGDSLKKTLIGVDYNDSIYGADTDEPIIPTANVSSIDVMPAVTGLVATEQLVRAPDGTINDLLFISWRNPATTAFARAEIWYSTGGSLIKAGETTGESHTMPVIELQTYTIAVRTINALGQAMPLPNAPRATITAQGKTAPPSDVAGFSVVANKAVIDLSWSPNSDADIAGYEIRQGATWDTAATLVADHLSSSFSWQPNQTGNLRFLIKGKDTSGNYSVTAAAQNLTITAPTVATLIQEVIDNNVLLRWANTPGTYAIDYAEIRRGLTFATAAVVGVVNGTFANIFETAAGTYKYWVVLRDIAGLYGAEAGIYATLSQPPDFVLRDQRTSNPAWAGTKNNCIIDVDGSLVCLVNTTETFQSHFTSHGWSTPQNQINAGYSLFAQPGTATGYYEETVDYGGTVSNSRITVDVTRVVLAGNVTITPKISVSLDNASWTDYNGQYQVYASNFRYVKYRLDLASADGGIMQITVIQTRLDMKLHTIQGEITANAADSGGTSVNITGEFIDVQAIILTPKGTTFASAVYDFTDVLNPTSFKVYLFNTAGARISGTVSYTVRGV